MVRRRHVHMTRWQRRLVIVAAVGLGIAGGLVFVEHQADDAAIADIQGFTHADGWQVASQHVALRTYGYPLPWEPTWGYVPRQGMHYGGGPEHWVSGIIPHPVLEIQLRYPLNAPGHDGVGCVIWDPGRGAQGGAAQVAAPPKERPRCGFGNETVMLSR
jgi:hypothetical protein